VRGLLDTSVFIAAESGRPLDEERIPEEAALSVVTLAELQAGVLAPATRSARPAGWRRSLRSATSRSSD
jgi:predicted nucleic acid-binding protein